MNRTRIIFFGILAITACVILSVVAVQLFNRDGNSETAVTPDSPEQIEVPSGSVLVTLASSNTKESWLNQVVEKFNAAQIETSGGSPIVVSVSHVTSGGSMNAILDGSSQKRKDQQEDTGRAFWTHCGHRERGLIPDLRRGKLYKRRNARG